MALINTTTTGVLGSTFYGDGAGALTVQKDGVTQGVYGNIPAFSAYKSANQTLSQNTTTKVTFDSEAYDTNNNFASNAFTPTVAGYYHVSGNMFLNGTYSRNYLVSLLTYKNGAAFARNVVSVAMGNGGDFSIAVAMPPVYMNGTTDYLELYAYQYDYSAGSTMTILGGSTYTTFGAYLVKAA